MFDRDDKPKPPDAAEDTVLILPVGACDAAARQTLCDALDGAGQPRAILLDLLDPPDLDGALFADPFAAPSLRLLADRIEARDIPVIALLDGAVGGPALALALAAHYRLATVATVIAGCEASVGLVPPAGALMRAVRLAGPAKARALYGAGHAMTAQAAHAAGLIDKVAQSLTLETGRRFAAAIRDRGLGARRSAEAQLGPTRSSAYFNALGMQRPDTPLDEAVEAALLLPPRGALDVSETLAEDTRRAAPVQRALHLASARAAAATDPAPQRIGILGSPAAMGDLADRLGTKARLVIHPDPDDQGDPARSLADLRDTDLMLVPLPPPLDLQKAITDGGPVTGPTALVTDLPVGASREIGRQFEGHVVAQRAAPELLELDRSEGASAGACAAAARGAGLTVIARAAGPVADRLRAQLRWAAFALLECGASPLQIDGAMRAYGYGCGVFEALDEAGLDAPHTMICEQMGPSRDARGGHLPAILRAAGRTGRAAGQGVYRYTDAGAEEDAALDHVLGQMRERKGLAPRSFDTAELTAALHAALVNAGAALVEAGQSPGSVDLAAVAALGFPADRGGPLWAADETGLIPLRKSVAQLAAEMPELWAPHPAWVDAIKYGRRLCPRF